MSTSQASLEVLGLVGFVLIVLAIVQIVYVRERAATFEETLLVEAKNTLSSLAATINEVYLGGTGYSANVTLPQKIGSYNYSITASSGHLYLKLSGFDISQSEKILPDTVSGEITQGKKRLSNTGGVVTIG